MAFGNGQSAGWPFSPQLQGPSDMVQPSPADVDQYGYDMQQIRQPHPLSTSAYESQTLATGFDPVTMGDMVSGEDAGDYFVGDEHGMADSDIMVSDEDSQMRQEYQHHGFRGSEGDEPEDEEFEDGDKSEDGEIEDEAGDNHRPYSSTTVGMKRKAPIEKAQPPTRAAYLPQKSSPSTATRTSTHWMVKKARSDQMVRFEVPFSAPPGKMWVAPTKTGPQASKSWLRSTKSKAALGPGEANQANISYPDTPVTGADSAYFYTNHQWPEMHARLKAAGWTERELAALHLYVHGKGSPDNVHQRAASLRQQKRYTRNVPVASNFDVSSFAPRTARRTVKHSS
ncbi:hypothetical protein LTR49_019753 [Elasticomyces elasticus]|nr:hypothetical protein LTR49_019753 [Elasticomyces elasticus]